MAPRTRLRTRYPKKKAIRTIEVRRIRGQTPTCPDEWVVMIPLVFCSHDDAVRYANMMVQAGNRLNPKVRTRWVLIESPPAGRS